MHKYIKLYVHLFIYEIIFKHKYCISFFITRFWNVLECTRRERKHFSFLFFLTIYVKSRAKLLWFGLSPAEINTRLCVFKFGFEKEALSFSVRTNVSVCVCVHWIQHVRVLVLKRDQNNLCRSQHTVALAVSCVYTHTIRMQCHRVESIDWKKWTLCGIPWVKRSQSLCTRAVFYLFL